VTSLLLSQQLRQTPSLGLIIQGNSYNNGRHPRLVETDADHHLLEAAVVEAEAIGGTIIAGVPVSVVCASVSRTASQPWGKYCVERSNSNLGLSLSLGTPLPPCPERSFHPM